MKKIQKYIVRPNIPKKLRPIIDIAYNLWWTWTPSAIELFRWVDGELWEKNNHNPIAMLGQVSDERYKELEQDDSFIRHLGNVSDDLKTYLEHPTWFCKNYKDNFGGKIAYFSFEFGIHESLSLYSGGLGVLSGDHLKSASELGIPLIGVGLIYRFGYFKQYLNIDGWQQEEYVENDFENMPITLVRGEDNMPLMVAIDFPDRVIYAQIWKLQVGRVPLYLLDTDIDANDQKDRELTYKLYGGDLNTRIKQEILLGIGGLRALQVLGIQPEVCHMNEGHAAFMVFEKTRMFMEKYGLSFKEARDMVSAGSLFTTHTPVPAGIDLFPPEMIATYFSNYARMFNMSIEELIGFGRQDKNDLQEYFSMPLLAFNFSDRSNGVSKLHGKVSRNMWRSQWPDLPDKLIPLQHVTNGIHIATWLSDEMARLYERYCGPNILDNPVDFSIFEKVENIPDMELWRGKERLRERLVSYARMKVQAQMIRRGSIRQKDFITEELLDPRALTIGFARRFATYKRATLLFTDPERLAKLLNDRDRPVQIIFAGKSHPKDNSGKEFIRKIVHIASQKDFRRKIVFLEDYNMDIARYLVQGVDVWLNTPRRPQEASGTSGMKVCPNGGINVSVLDGWWVEGYNKENGWAIGGESYSDPETQDKIEALALYEILENEVIPTFYDRGVDGIPREWIKLMKNSMKTISPFFNTNRMVHEYFSDVYYPAFVQYEALNKDNRKAAKDLQDWKDYIRANWYDVRIDSVDADELRDLKVGMDLQITANIHLGKIQPNDVKVALFHGSIDTDGDISDGKRIWMKPADHYGNGTYLYKGNIPLDFSGQRGFAVCVYADTKKLNRRFEKAYIKWWLG